MATGYPNYVRWAEDLRKLADGITLAPNSFPPHKIARLHELLETIRVEAEAFQENVQRLSGLNQENVQSNEARLEALEDQAQISNSDNNELSLHSPNVSLSESAEAGHPPGLGGVLAQGAGSSSAGALRETEEI